MIGTRYEEYEQFIDGLPFVLHTDLKRNSINRSKDNNWHENLEIQLCTAGSGMVLLNGEKFLFNQNDIVVVNSNTIHYTGTDTALTYCCFIVSTNFCKQVGLDPNFISFEPLIQNPVLVNLFEDLVEIYSNSAVPYRMAKLNKIALEILIELAERHITLNSKTNYNARKFEIVKKAVSYIRENYARRLTIEEISKAVLYDKYTLCREFKRFTGQTIVESLNNYRCVKAIEFLSNGYTVAQTAALCGFVNLSFFAKMFKKYIGKLPSEYKKQSVSATEKLLSKNG